MNNELKNIPEMEQQKLSEMMDMMEPELTVEEIQELLETTQKGAVKNNRHNCKVILEHDPLLKGIFRYNILTGQVDIVKELWWKKEIPAINDMDMNYIMLYLEETYGITIDKVVQKSIDHEADRHKYHPIRDYLNGLEWDGQERIRYVLHRFLGAPVNNLTYESMKMFLLRAISRVFTPGIKFEYMLCIVGGQGIGKSTFSDCCQSMMIGLLMISRDWMMKIFIADYEGIGWWNYLKWLRLPEQKVSKKRKVS